MAVVPVESTLEKGNACKTMDEIMNFLNHFLLSVEGRQKFIFAAVLPCTKDSKLAVHCILRFPFFCIKFLQRYAIIGGQRYRFNEKHFLLLLFLDKR